MRMVFGRKRWLYLYQSSPAEWVVAHCDQDSALEAYDLIPFPTFDDARSYCFSVVGIWTRLHQHPHIVLRYADGTPFFTNDV